MDSRDNMTEQWQKFYRARFDEIDRDPALLARFSRVIGIGFPLVFCVLIPWIFSVSPLWVVLRPSIVVLVFGVVAPQWLAWPYVLWMGLGYLLHRLNAVIIFGILYYLVICPIGILFRIIGRDPMNRVLQSKVVSYRSDFSGDNPLERVKNIY